MSPKDAPGYTVKDSVSSRAGGCFVAANGEPIKNQGELILDLLSGTAPIKTTFQAADITKPLWSVSKICQAGYTVTFDANGAVIRHAATGADVGTFSLRNGFYACDMKLKNPAFTRPGSR